MERSGERRQEGAVRSREEKKQKRSREDNIEEKKIKKRQLTARRK